MSRSPWHNEDHLQSVDVVWYFQLIKLLLYVCDDLQLELGAAKKVEGYTCQQHVHGMLNGNSVRPCFLFSMEGTCTHHLITAVTEQGMQKCMTVSPNTVGVLFLSFIC